MPDEIRSPKTSVIHKYQNFCPALTVPENGEYARKREGENGVSALSKKAINQPDRNTAHVPYAERFPLPFPLGGLFQPAISRGLQKAWREIST